MGKTEIYSNTGFNGLLQITNTAGWHLDVGFLTSSLLLDSIPCFLTLGNSHFLHYISLSMKSNCPTCIGACYNYNVDQKKKLQCFACSVMTLGPTRSFCPWHSPGKNTGVGCYALLWGIFPTQGPNPGLPYCRLILYFLSH